MVLSPAPGPRPAVVIDGVARAAEVLDQLRSCLERAGRPELCLATVRVGDDQGARYIAYKHEAARSVGMRAVGIDLPDTAGQGEVEEAVASLDARPDVHGVFVQLPLPAGIDTQAVMDTISPAKDVDGLGARSLGRLVSGPPGHVPATPLAVLRLLRHHGALRAGAQAVVLGRSPYVALPVALLLARAGATVTVADLGPEPRDGHERARVVACCRQADLVVSALDRPGLVTEDWVRPGAAVVDLGLTRVGGRLTGDVDVAAVSRVARWVCPNPGGVGPMTVALLLEATARAGGLPGLPPLEGAANGEGGR